MNCQTKIKPIDRVRKINSIGLLLSIKFFMVSSFGNKKSWMLDKTQEKADQVNKDGVLNG